MPQEKDLQNIIKEALNGDQVAYTDLLNRYWNDIYNFLLSKGNFDDEAEDLTINTFSKAFDKLNLYNPNYTFKGWLITIANNLYIDYLRSKRKNIADNTISTEYATRIADESESAEDSLIKEQQLNNLLNCINKLKPHYRQIIQLRYLKECSIKEIALELDESLNNIKVKLLRARKLLNEQIRQQDNY